MITDSLRGVIEGLHQAIADEPQPEDKAVLAQCLQNVLKVQAKNYAEGDYGRPGSSQRGSVLAQLGGGQEPQMAGGPPQGVQ